MVPLGPIAGETCTPLTLKAHFSEPALALVFTELRPLWPRSCMNIGHGLETSCSLAGETRPKTRLRAISQTGSFNRSAAESENDLTALMPLSAQRPIRLSSQQPRAKPVVTTDPLYLYPEAAPEV